MKRHCLYMTRVGLPASFLLLCWFLTIHVASQAGAPDFAFPQDVSIKYTTKPDLAGARLMRLEVDNDFIVYVLTDKGVARGFDSVLALDRSFRPLTGKIALDMDVGRGGNLYYLFEGKFLSNGESGKPLGILTPEKYQQLAVADDGSVFLAGAGGLGIFRQGKVHELEVPTGTLNGKLYTHRNEFFFMMSGMAYRVAGLKVTPLARHPDMTCLGFRGEGVIVGTKHGFFGVDIRSARTAYGMQTNLPSLHITSLLPTPAGLWAGTTRGAFFQGTDGTNSYYASKRWLADDHVLDIQAGPGKDVFILTKTAVNRIQYKPMTLAQKAAIFEAKIRQRHIRYGLCSELRLTIPGDPTSAEMIDTDNDGTWSNYYMASQAFHYAATGNVQARNNAWETFSALERLEAINGLGGFPSRTMERAGFKYSDVDRWPPSKDGQWEWKATTSSDEIAAHTFGCAVLHECVAKTPADKQRIATFFDKIMSRIVRDGYKLIDHDGNPTTWGRWDPEYVNQYPPTIFDRRLNSTEIIASLQLAHKLTEKEFYRDKAIELLEKRGYLQNILTSVENVSATEGFKHEGNIMGDEWNHSDDLLAFITYWVLHRTAFDEALKRQYAAVIQDHFAIEKEEKNPIWSFVLAATGEKAKEYDLDGALHTLRRFPMDLVSWHMENSYRGDITLMGDNFRKQQVKELLPMSERAISRWNGQPFVLDGGDGGFIEYAGDEFLLPYWMGRYLKLID